MTKVTWGIVAMALAVTAYLGVPSSAQVKKGKELVLQTKNWTAGVNLPHCSALGEILKAGISEDKAWSEAVQHAEVLNESGHVLMADSRCPDKVWADAGDATARRQRCHDHRARGEKHGQRESGF